MWASPIAKQYARIDEHGLFMIAVLRDAFVRDPQPALAAEIRLQDARFGLDPMSRRRLGWEIREQAPASPEHRKRGGAKRDDPRAVLGDPLRFLRQQGKPADPGA